MKQRKSSQSLSNALLYEIFTKKCTQLLTNCNSNQSRQFMQINQTIKFTTSTINQIKTTKTITTRKVTKNKILVSNIVSQSSFREVAMQKAQQLHKKQEELLAELMRHIVQNIKLKLERILIKTMSNLTNNKDIFLEVIDILEDQYELINQQLARVRKYTKRKQIKNVINLQIDSVTASQFVQLVFANLPQLKDYYQKFQTQIFTNQQLEDLRQYELIEQLIDINQLIQKRIKQKKQKKKNKKKKNKNKTQADDTTILNQKVQNLNKQIELKSNHQQNKIIQFLQNMEINQDRTTCCLQDDWIKNLSLKYGR